MIDLFATAESSNILKSKNNQSKNIVDHMKSLSIRSEENMEQAIGRKRCDGGMEAAQFKAGRSTHLKNHTSVPRKPFNPSNNHGQDKSMVKEVPESSGTSYHEQCQKESERLLRQCPRHLRGVYQSFLRQAEAFNLADQCNKGQPLLPEPEVVVSKVQDLMPYQRIEVKHTENEVPIEEEPNRRDSAKTDPESTELNDLTEIQEKKFKTHSERSKKARERSEAEIMATRAMYDRFMIALEELNRCNSNQKDAPKDVEVVNSNIEERIDVVDINPQVETINPRMNDSNFRTKAQETTESSENNPAETPFHLDRREEPIRVFCVECPNQKRPGTFYRNFITTSLSSVWRKYLESSPYELHWYEVIREERPCHLYFDLEYGRGPDWNEGLDDNGIVDLLLHHVVGLFDRNWGIKIQPDQHVYELDSSSQVKFSRHVIVNVPGYGFYNNSVAGHFVAQIISAVGTALDVYKAPPPENKKVCVIDSAVYSRNRHFRMVYCCKGGKAAILRPTDRFATAPGTQRPSPAKIFQDTYISNVAIGAKLLLVHSLDQKFLYPFRTNGDAVMLSYHGDIIGNGFGQCRISWKIENQEQAKNATNTESSEFEKLKNLAEKAIPYVELIAKRRSGQVAQARTMRFCGSDGKVAYSMMGKNFQTPLYSILLYKILHMH